MKHLMTTTALVTLLAFPLAAQESGQAGTQTEQAQSGQSSATALQGRTDRDPGIEPDRPAALHPARAASR